ncbi:uncharacterized protein VDAG_04318 [Verticillium dahliae VdLs.17]|uniref:AMP-binding enzyme C-terminal domain-containing protein n=1 Tax=Verticillium dahliae (strain VdLs.17 / ATCC MYA-4575 / FGSC 10137) TaxID=498257 RepID=G2X1Z4_VERDV|nr:uncharacterized protein VDAG_04318 [Verticillium dahliae VdLs.17]EGY22880.1 hypothetical protein VDAG_04318 [Verticillium dahliae VdLs.17]
MNARYLPDLSSWHDSRIQPNAAPEVLLQCNGRLELTNVVDLLTLLFAELPSKDDTILHVEASNPDNRLSKAQTATLTRIAHILRHDFGVGASINGQVVVVCISFGEVLLQVELIKYKGLQVAPAELEALLLSHPAYIVTDVNKISEGEVQASVKRELASYERLRGGGEFPSS